MSRTSVMEYREAEKNLTTIASELGVGAILEDLRARGELPPLEAEPPKGESEDEDPSPRAGP